MKFGFWPKTNEFEMIKEVMDKSKFLIKTHLIKHSQISPISEMKLFTTANSRRIVWACLTILWGWHLKGYLLKGINN